MSTGKANQPSLRSTEWPRFLRGPDARLLENLYIPALSRAVRYDRCCAYFSSHVLAVAARGFGGFIENLQAHEGELSKPAARLLVNEQLDPEDLDALLTREDPEPLIKKLCRQFKTPREALEKNRLAMLAWLVASGWLEVRVGVMRRTQGILHAKFGLIGDLCGDVLAFSGSGNETGQALVENYEEIEIRPSWEDPEFVRHFQERFDTLWEDRDEYVKTLPLPEAVREKIVRLAPATPPRELTIDKQAAAVTMFWHFLAAAPYLANGEAACDATAPVDPWPHQRRVVEDTARAYPAGRLLCDEVGMGKTIEAILVLRRLLSGRGVRRALLLVPAGLLRQWQDELREKGGLLVPYWDRGWLCHPDGHKEKMEAQDALCQHDIVLLSREWARLPNNREAVLTAPRWDLTLLDEAHAARRSSGVEREFNSANLLLGLLRELQLRRRTRGIILLSATPMQTQPWEPWDLLAVLGVGGRWEVEFQDIRTYYNGVAALVSGQRPDMATAALIGALVASDEEFPPPPRHLSSGGAQSVAQALMFLPSRDACKEYAQWLRKGAPLGRRMHRNTRRTLRQYYRLGLLSTPPARRDVRDDEFDYQNPAERECYEAITDYIDRRYAELEAQKSGKGFVMTIYRRRAASSPLALRRSLQRRMERLDRVIHKQWVEEWLSPDEEQMDVSDLVDEGIDERIDQGLPSTPEGAAAEKEEIQSLLERLEALGNVDSKLAKFWEVLQEVTSDGRSVLVFTEYTDTMEYLRDRLRPTYSSTLGCFSGDGGQVWDGRQWVRVSKAEIAERLNDGSLKVLICTDAASEGLNLQAAGALINYDLPWNPSKVEQRIGRIDRIGQRQPVLPIRNLFLRDSVDMRVYEVLKERCGLFTHFVGHMQPVLAAARTALRVGLKPEEAERFIRELEERARDVETDNAATNAFVESEAEPQKIPTAPVTRRDIEWALDHLNDTRGKVKARRIKGSSTWRLSRPGRKSWHVTTDREALEKDAAVVPITLGSEIVEDIARTLPLTSRMPLVVAGASEGAFRCVEARWVGPDRVTKVESASQLLELIAQWDGMASPPADSMVRAEEEARAEARRRALEMKERARRVEEAGLRQQVEAARRRLRRELGRTLRCLDSGDLNEILHAQIRREKGPSGRYHRALQLLGGYPRWTPEELEEIERFVRGLKPKQRKARVAGSEVDAALNDPRWTALASSERSAD